MAFRNSVILFLLAEASFAKICGGWFDLHRAEEIYNQHVSNYTVRSPRQIDLRSSIAKGDAFEVHRDLPPITKEQAKELIRELSEFGQVRHRSSIRVIRENGKWIAVELGRLSEKRTLPYYVRQNRELPALIVARLDALYERLRKNYSEEEYHLHRVEIRFGEEYDSRTENEFHYDRATDVVGADAAFGFGTIGLGRGGYIFAAPPNSATVFEGKRFLHVARPNPGLRIFNKMTLGREELLKLDVLDAHID